MREPNTARARHGTAASQQRVGRRGEGGETLVESMLTIALVSIVLIGSASFVVSLTAVSMSRQQQVRTANEAVAASEALKSLPYIPCGTRAQYNAAFQAVYVPPSNFNAQVVVSGVLYLAANGPNDTTASFPDPPGPCTQDRGAQKIRLRVARAGTQRATEIHFVKRDNRCSETVAPGVTVPFINDAKPGQRC